MTRALFEIDPDGRGSFVYPREMYERIVQPFHELLDQRDGGRIAETVYVRELKNLLELEPDFIDGYAHVANTLWDKGKTKGALDMYLQGVAVGERVIPPGFAGMIEWVDRDNRPFLRALHGAALSYLRLRRYKDAAATMERILKYNPNDNQGIRYLLGTVYLRAGQIEQAQAALEAEKHSFPPCAYDLAFVYLQKRAWVKAATALRLGFCTNPYIAEMLCGVTFPQFRAMWHSSNHAMPETAQEYVGASRDLWDRHPDFLAFMSWLFNHSRILAERAQVQGPLEAMLSAESGDKRVALSRASDAALEAIDDTLSNDIIVKLRGRDGRDIYPWQYLPPGYR